MASFSERQAISKPRRKSGLQDFSLSFCQIIPQPAQSDRAFFFIEQNVSGSPVSIPWLANAASVDKVLLSRLQGQLFKWHAYDRTILYVSPWSVGMPKKAEFRCLPGKTGSCVQLV